MTAIAALGDVDIDLLVTVDRYPRPGEESFAEDAVVGLGGSAVNTAAALAHLGFTASILAQVGDDDFGRRARSLLAETGVHTGHLLVTESAPTGMNVVIVTQDGERTMLGLRGANRFYPGSGEGLGSFQWLHLSGYALMEEPQRSAALAAVTEARERKLPISVDIPSGVARTLGADLIPILSDVHVLAVGREPLTHIFPGPDPVTDLLAAGVETVAVTEGGRPFDLCRADQSVTVTPPSVEVVDTTGAGDSFVAGLVAGTLWNLDLGPMATVAAALGAAATGRRGAGSDAWDREVLTGILDRWTGVDPGWVEAARHRLT